MKKERNRINLKGCLANGGYRRVIFEHCFNDALERGARYEVIGVNYDEAGVNIARLIIYEGGSKINKNAPLGYLLSDRVVERG